MRTSIVKGLFPVFLVLLFLLLSCDNAIKIDDLKGEWKSIKAKRNGKETQTLDKVFFAFNYTDSITTNLFGQIETYPMNYSYPIIELESSNLKEINVLSLEGDSLSISLRIRQYRYDFDLIKR